MTRPWPVALEAEDPAVRLRGLTKRFGKVVALDGVDVTVPTGSVALVLYYLAARLSRPR